MPEADTPTVVYDADETARRARWSEDAERTICRAIEELCDLGPDTESALPVVQLLHDLLDRLEDRPLRARQLTDAQAVADWRRHRGV